MSARQIELATTIYLTIAVVIGFTFEEPLVPHLLEVSGFPSKGENNRQPLPASEARRQPTYSENPCQVRGSNQRRKDRHLEVGRRVR